MDTVLAYLYTLMAGVTVLMYFSGRSILLELCAAEHIPESYVRLNTFRRVMCGMNTFRRADAS